MKIQWQPPKQFKLGEIYNVCFNYRNKFKCKFIQPTRCGYNFLNLKTNKCILRQHIYPSKKIEKQGLWFFLNRKINIEHVKEEKKN